MQMDMSRNVNTVTYCMVCGSAIYWDADGNPALLRIGDDNIVTCLQTGCSLVFAGTRYSTGNFELFRTNLVEAGIPAEAALSIAAIVATYEAKTIAA